MNTTMNADGPVTRKTLASQLDRLDRILDGLADGLQEAITAAVQGAVGAAVRETVRAVLAELLTSPMVLERLQAVMAPAAPVAPAPSATPTHGRGRQVREWLGTSRHTLRRAVTAGLRQARGGLIAVRASLRAVRPYRNQLLAAAGVGVLAGVLAYLAGPWLVALASGLGSFATPRLVRAGLWVKRAWGTTPAVEA